MSAILLLIHASLILVQLAFLLIGCMTPMMEMSNPYVADNDVNLLQ